MLIYKYIAIDKQGISQAGAITAINEQEVFAKLQINNLQPLKISKQRFISQKLKSEDVLLFFLHISFQLKCGAYIDEAIDSFIKFHGNDVLNATLIQISEDLKNGEKISSAFQKHCSFNTVIIGLLQAAENTGSLTETISNILKLLQFQNSWKRNIKNILAYPIFIALLAVVILLVSSHFLGPQVVALLKNYGTNDVPVLTLFAIDVLPILSNILAGILFVIISGISICMTNQYGRKFMLQLSYSIPILSKLIKKVALWQFFRLLHIAYVAKLDFIAAFNLAYQTIKIDSIKNQLDIVKENIINGHKISVSFSKMKDLATDVAMAIFVGEEGNNLEQTFQHVSEKSYAELINDIKSLGNTLSVSLTLFTGMIFVLVLCSLFQPIYNYIGMAGA